MSRCLAAVWLALVLLAGGHVAWRVQSGLLFVTDLMALLPEGEQDGGADRAQSGIAATLARQILLLPGHADPAIARAAARTIAAALATANLITPDDSDLDPNRLRQVAAFYAPYRGGLLADRDRDLLVDGQAAMIATRALSQVFGVPGLGDASQLRRDPFLLLPGFLTALPLPNTALVAEDGVLRIERDGRTWVLIAERLARDPNDLDTQRAVTEALDPVIAALRARHPGLEVPRLGAVFFAEAAASEAMRETTMIGLASVAGTALIILVVFRRLTPLWFALLAIGTGVLTALSACLILFGDVHVGALLFGVSLIGVAVDYSLQYSTEALDPATTPAQRLNLILAGITLGMLTTVIGYLTLLLAPFPGLHQVAVFSAIGLLAAWLTTVLWLPLLDRRTGRRAAPSPRPKRADDWAGIALIPWTHAGWRWPRRGLFLVLLAAAAFGMTRFHRDDDIRRMQALSPALLAQQERLRSVIGQETERQFFVVTAADSETALQREEILGHRLRALVATGALDGFRGPARFVPSAQRQRDDRALAARVLDAPRREAQFQRLGLRPGGGAGDDPAEAPVLTLARATQADSPLRFLSRLVLDDEPNRARHVVMLDGVRDQAALAAAARDLAWARLIDPAGSFSDTLARYRDRALILLVLSAALMMIPLLWRYRPVGAARVIIPPSLAVLLTPGLRAWGGDGFSFFDAIALVLVLAMGMDYAVFMAETTRERLATTALAILLAAATTLLSFGLLALSSVRAVHQFGATMAVGIALAALLSPMARRPWRRSAVPLAAMALPLVLLSPGCAPLPAPATGVTIAPGLVLALPPPDSLGRHLEASQIVIARHDGRTVAFESRISATSDRVSIACVDPMGRRVMEITWTRDGITETRSADIPATLTPGNMLADLVLLYWPEPVVRAALAGSAGTLTVDGDIRRVSVNGGVVIEAGRRTDPAWDTWTGSVRLRNLAWGYSLDIQSRIIGP